MENTIDYTEQLEEIYSELNYITTTMEIESGERAMARQKAQELADVGTALIPMIACLLIVKFFTGFLFKGIY